MTYVVGRLIPTCQSILLPVVRQNSALWIKSTDGIWRRMSAGWIPGGIRARNLDWCRRWQFEYQIAKGLRAFGVANESDGENRDGGKPQRARKQVLVARNCTLLEIRNYSRSRISLSFIIYRWRRARCVAPPKETRSRSLAIVISQERSQLARACPWNANLVIDLLRHDSRCFSAFVFIVCTPAERIQ